MLDIVWDTNGCITGLASVICKSWELKELLDSVDPTCSTASDGTLKLMAIATASAMNMINDASILCSWYNPLPRVEINIAGFASTMYAEFDCFHETECLLFRLYQQNDNDYMFVERFIIETNNRRLELPQRQSILPHEILHVIFSYISKYAGCHLLLRSALCIDACPNFNQQCKNIFIDYIRRMNIEYQGVVKWHPAPATAILLKGL